MFWVFAVTASAADLEILHLFKGDPEGGFHAGQFVYLDDHLYGTVADGGDSLGGAIYEVDLADDAFKLIHSFDSKEGIAPSVLSLSDSTLFGTTSARGPSDGGTLFSLSLDSSKFQLLHGWDKVTPAPVGLTIAGKAIYGLTTADGTSGLGTLFKANLDGSEFASLHDFDEKSAPPVGPPVVSDAAVYGATEHGGDEDAGAVFTVGTDGAKYAILHSFGSDHDGPKPSGAPLLVGAQLFGVTREGGDYGAGSIYRLNQDGSKYTVLHSLTGDEKEGASPFGALQLVDDHLVGLTSGLKDQGGSLFSLSLDGEDFTQLYHFAAADFQPSANFLFAGGALYGTTDSAKGADALYAIRNVPEPAGILLIIAGLLVTASRRRG